MLPNILRRSFLAAGFLAVTPAVASAQFAMCGERALIIDQLKTKYNETRQAVGLISNNGAAELFVSEKGTWTMLVTDQAGITCIIAAGEAWDDAPLLVQGTGI